MEKYIITGGPGVGKTNILQELEKVGEVTLSEVAREIIAEEQKKEKGVLPWTDLAEFQKKTMHLQVDREKRVNGKSHKRIFQDRGLVDTIAYAEEGGVKVPDGLYDRIKEAGYTRVFYLEQLPFYKQDEERKEDSEFAKRIHEKLYQVYDRLGFDIVMVPVFHPEKKENIEARVNLILSEADHVKNREIERKYRVDHDIVKEALERYVVNHLGTDHEENTLYDVNDILKEIGYTFRIRQNKGEHILTLKGPSKSKEFTNKPEYNFLIPAIFSKALDFVLPEAVSYPKRRENYRPLGDSRCTISLDHVQELGEFVEIEAASENQVLLWEKRLSLSPYLINKSYPTLVREKRGK